MTDKELLQQALDALKHLCLNTSAIKGYDGHKVQPAIKAIKARLAQPEPEPEPVAYDLNGATVYIKPPLYTTPPKKEWVGLTDDERDEIYNRHSAWVHAVEAKLKEKNNG